jgi:hypothetical protein
MTDTMTILSPRQEGQPGAWGYHYKHGDRPLEGFTIQRAAGRGGFGEVYYAISDSGREAALKFIQTYEQIELRGISQCMNLKSPHLVTIFDVKYGTDGRPWVIMEYVSGPSLRQLLDAAPSGLGTQKAAFFLREIGKGLTYLHDSGIVHRDLKPANIFYENGYVKIGDYGLSKSIGADQGGGQTVSVGTVHYMAPEIGAGNYGKSIDIYALGAVLHEMLTGQVPFFGASAAEVLMKHLTDEVDVGNIAEPFKTVIRKAMAKNPADRYQNVQEMVEAVFGSEHIRNSVSHFAPDTLTMIAGHAARKIEPGTAGGSFTPSDAPTPRGNDGWGRMAGLMDRMGGRIARVGERISAELPAQPGNPLDPGARDPLKLRHRVILAGAAALLVALLAGIHGAGQGTPELGVFAFLTVTTGAAAIMLAWRFLAPALRQESPWIRRLVVGGIGGLTSIVCTLPIWAIESEREFGHHAGGIVLGLLAAFLLIDWSARLNPNRRERVIVGQLFTAGLCAFILCSMLGAVSLVGIFTAVGTSLLVSLLSPWSPRQSEPQKPVSGAFPSSAAGIPPSTEPIAAAPPLPVSPAVAAPLPVPTPALRSVSRFGHGLWLGLFIALTTLGLCLWLVLAFDAPRTDGEIASMFAFGAGSLVLGAFCLRRSFQPAFAGWWTYLFRPLIQFACLQSILTSIALLASGALDDRDAVPAVFFIVFPLVLLCVVTFVRRGTPMTSTNLSIYPAGEPFSLSGIVLGVVRFALTVAGSAVLIFAMLMAVAVTSDLPGLFASGVLDPNMPHELAQDFGTREWPQLMLHIGVVITFAAGLVATVLFLLARRRWGAAHMLRAICGITVLLAGAVALGHALPDWFDFVPLDSPAATMEAYFHAVRVPAALWAAGLVVFGGFLLLWPPAGRQGAVRQLSSPAPVAAGAN